MKVLFTVAIILALLASFVLAQSEPAKYPLTETELYVVGKLKSDSAELQRAASQLAAAQKAHDASIKAFISDASKGRGIALKEGQALGLTPDEKAFYVIDAAPVTSR